MSEILNFDKGNINKLYFKFALPSIAGLLMISMQLVIDGIFVSKVVGPLGLAAVNLSMPLINIILSVALMIICGGVVVASIAKGNKDEDLARSYTTLTLVTFIITILALSGLLLINLDGVCRFLGADGEVLPYVKSYLGVMIGGAILYSIPNFSESFCRLMNKPQLVFVSGLVGVITNVTLDYIFLYKLGWGITGAAAATLLACAASAIALFPFLKFGKLRGSVAVIKRIFFNGSSEMLSVVSSAITTYVFNIVLMEQIGAMGVAALTIVFYINMIVNLSLFGLAQALQPLVAYNLGAMNYPNIKKLLRTSIIAGACIGWGFYLISLFAGDSIINIFTDGDADLFKLAQRAALFITIHYLFSFANVIISSFHTAIEKPIESALIALCRSIIFVLIPLFTLPLILGNTGIWLSMPVAEVLCLCVSIPLLLSSMKKLKTKTLKR